MRAAGERSGLAVAGVAWLWVGFARVSAIAGVARVRVPQCEADCGRDVEGVASVSITRFWRLRVGWALRAAVGEVSVGHAGC